MILRKLLPYAFATTMTSCSSYMVSVDKESGLFKEGDIVRVIQLGEVSYKISIPFRRYLYYKDLPHPNDAAENLQHYTTPNEPELEDIIRALNLPTGSQEKDAQKLLDFAHSFIYVPDIDGYTKTPLETIVEGGGDCEDLSVLAYSLLKRAGHDVIYLEIPPYEGSKGGHILVGVAGNFGGANVIYENKRYFLAETTGTEWPHQPAQHKIGDLPVPIWTKLKDVKVYQVK